MQSRCHSRLLVEPAYLRAQKRHDSEADIADPRGEERAGSRKAPREGACLLLVRMTWPRPSFPGGALSGCKPPTV